MWYKEWLFKTYDDNNFILLKRMLNGTPTKLALNLYGIIRWHNLFIREIESLATVSKIKYYILT